MNHSIRDNDPEGVWVTGVRGFRPTEGRTNGGRKKEGVGGVGTVRGVREIRSFPPFYEILPIKTNVLNRISCILLKPFH
jgi:hypothetical protein